MTSDFNEKNCFVWIWLPGSSEPVVAGRLVRQVHPIVSTYVSCSPSKLYELFSPTRTR